MSDCHRFVAAGLLLSLCLAGHARGFEGIVTSVVDGDSVWVRPVSGGPPRQVRLRGIDAPEICQAYGAASREALVSRVLHRRVQVNSRARDGYQRVLGHLSLDGQDVGAWMVGKGHAWSYRFDRGAGPYPAEESRARKARLGLWAHGRPMEPREFRKRHGSCR
jgi:micrococcal nuclease